MPKHSKPSAILLRAAEMVDDYNKAREGYRGIWEFGCHAIDCAAIEAGALRRAVGVRDKNLVTDLPETWGYFELMKPAEDLDGGRTWFSPAHAPEPKYDSGKHRVIALLMAAAIAKAEKK